MKDEDDRDEVDGAGDDGELDVVEMRLKLEENPVVVDDMLDPVPDVEMIVEDAVDVAAVADDAVDPATDTDVDEVKGYVPVAEVEVTLGLLVEAGGDVDAVMVMYVVCGQDVVVDAVTDAEVDGEGVDVDERDELVEVGAVVLTELEVAVELIVVDVEDVLELDVVEPEDVPVVVDVDVEVEVELEVLLIELLELD